MKPLRIALWIVFFETLFVVVYWKIYALSPTFHNRYIRNEDHAVEWITCIGFFLAALVMGTVAKMARKAPRFGRLYLVGLALFFFMCAGEEISWGQRIFHFKTPASVKKSNEQKEFNLHNLKIKYIHPVAMVSAFMKVFGIGLPLIAWLRTRKADAPWRRYLPAPFVIAAFLFPEALGQLVHLIKPTLKEAWGEAGWTLVRLDTNEMVEMYWGLAVFMASLTIRSAWARTARGDEAGRIDAGVA